MSIITRDAAEYRPMTYYVGLALEVLGIFLGLTSLGLVDATEAVGALFMAGATLIVAGYLVARRACKR